MWLLNNQTVPGTASCDLLYDTANPTGVERVIRVASCRKRWVLLFLHSLYLDPHFIQPQDPLIFGTRLCYLLTYAPVQRAISQFCRRIAQDCEIVNGIGCHTP